MEYILPVFLSYRYRVAPFFSHRDLDLAVAGRDNNPEHTSQSLRRAHLLEVATEKALGKRGGLGSLDLDERNYLYFNYIRRTLYISVRVFFSGVYLFT